MPVLEQPATPANSSSSPQPSTIGVGSICPDSLRLAHLRYGHIGGRRLQGLIQHNALKGLPNLPRSFDHASLISGCDACLTAKMTRRPFGALCHQHSRQHSRQHSHHPRRTRSLLCSTTTSLPHSPSPARPRHRSRQPHHHQYQHLSRSSDAHDPARVHQRASQLRCIPSEHSFLSFFLLRPSPSLVHSLPFILLSPSFSSLLSSSMTGFLFTSVSCSDLLLSFGAAVSVAFPFDSFRFAWIASIIVSSLPSPSPFVHLSFLSTAPWNSSASLLPARTLFSPFLSLFLSQFVSSSPPPFPLQSLYCFFFLSSSFLSFHFFLLFALHALGVILSLYTEAWPTLSLSLPFPIGLSSPRLSLFSSSFSSYVQHLTSSHLISLLLSVFSFPFGSSKLC